MPHKIAYAIESRHPDLLFITGRVLVMGLFLLWLKFKWKRHWTLLNKENY